MTERILVWDWPVRVFHWSLAGLVTAAYVLSESERWRAVHAGIGYVVLGLLAFRLLWFFVGTRHARFRGLAHGPRAVWDDLRGASPPVAGHTPAGSWMIVLLLVAGLAAGTSGWLAYREGAAEWLAELHESLAQGWVMLALFHVAGAIVSSLRHRDNLVLGMLTGRKRGPSGEAIASARPWAGALLALLVVGGAAWALAQRAGPASIAGAQPALAVDADGDHDQD